jgi:hypothetical protein
MKKLFFIFFLSAICSSCSSDSSSATELASLPDAKNQYDDSSFGIYKGVFVGSTGTVVINIYNDGEATATLTINGSSSTYTATENITEDLSIEGLTFTKGNNYFDFNVSGDGSDPLISNIYIYGHPDAKIAVSKEFSYSLVRCFVGTYSGENSGIFNIITEGDNVYGLGKDGNEYYSFYLNGSISGSTLEGTFENGTFVGTINGNDMSGNWQNIFSENGSWSGTRRL